MPETTNIFAPHSVPLGSFSSDTYIQPNLNYALRVWWAFYWPTNLVSFVLGMLLHYGVVHLYETTAFPAVIVAYILRIGPYVLTYGVAIFVMRYILSKDFRRFRIALLSTAVNSPQPLPATFSRTLRVWWIYSWRTLVYSLLGLALVIYPLGMFVGLFKPGPQLANLIFGVLGFLMNAAFSLFVLYSNILDEELGDFRVSLLPHLPTGDPFATPAS